MLKCSKRARTIESGPVEMDKEAPGKSAGLALDGEHDDRLIEEFNNRCDLSRNASLTHIRSLCQTGDDCFNLMRIYLEEVERCYKNWHLMNRTITHSMNDFTNALVYAFSVYTTIGYGNMAADTPQCRMATIIYGAFGIPLFFAFVKEEGNLFRNVFIYIYNRISKWRRRHCGCHFRGQEDNSSSPSANQQNGNAESGINRGLLEDEIQTKKAHFARKYSAASLLEAFTAVLRPLHIIISARRMPYFVNSYRNYSRNFIHFISKLNSNSVFLVNNQQESCKIRLPIMRTL
ncbi:unnamed protein product [Nippostrongylus brasiliensis]|uniref:Ion_trans_2 domain-containing protein n=1 Tax=Nippostrongylus brasiliensis TaxID=27835 RepID=A0A0N4Y9S7_NIPBR|nr:unnamed protein product [Nippostrongylus brasiliensis]